MELIEKEQLENKMEQLEEIIKQLHVTRSYFNYMKLKTDLDNLIENHKRSFTRYQKNVQYWEKQKNVYKKGKYHQNAYAEWWTNTIHMRYKAEDLKSMILVRQQFFFLGAEKFFL